MSVFVEGGNPENLEKKNPRSRDENKYKLNPHLATGRIRTRVILIGGERSHQCAIPAPFIEVYRVVFS